MAITAFGIWFAYITFPKRGKIYILIVIALIAATIQEIFIHVRILSKDSLSMYIASLAISAICYFYLFFVVNELYVLRLRSLGCGVVKYESLAKYVPYLILFIAVCVYVEFAVFAFVPGIMEVSVYIGISIGLFAVALLLEVYLSVILIMKVLLMLEYREDTRRRTILKAKLYLLIIVILEFAIFFTRIFSFNPDSPEGHIRVLGFLVRILIVIDFYKDIILSITSDDENDGLMMRNFYSAQDSGLVVSDPGNMQNSKHSSSLP